MRTRNSKETRAAKNADIAKKAEIFLAKNAAKKTAAAAAGKIAPTSATTNLINDFRGVSDKKDAPEEVIGKKVGEAEDDATSSSLAEKTLLDGSTEEDIVEGNVPTPAVLSKTLAIDKTAINDAREAAAKAEDEYAAPYFADPDVLKSRKLPLLAFEPDAIDGPTPFGDDDIRFVEVSNIFLILGFFRYISKIIRYIAFIFCYIMNRYLVI